MAAGEKKTLKTPKNTSKPSKYLEILTQIWSFSVKTGVLGLIFPLSLQARGIRERRFVPAPALSAMVLSGKNTPKKGRKFAITA